jgi:hypothetical protein
MTPKAPRAVPALTTPRIEGTLGHRRLPPGPEPPYDRMSRVIEDVVGDGSLLLSTEGGVATVTLNRPDKHNAIHLAMWEAFGRLMPALAADDTVDVVVLRGPEGGPFSAGADISEFTTLRADPESAERYGEAVTSGSGRS